jgi:hypothetical protein
MGTVLFLAFFMSKCINDVISQTATLFFPNLAVLQSTQSYQGSDHTTFQRGGRVTFHFVKTNEQSPFVLGNQILVIQVD